MRGIGRAGAHCALTCLLLLASMAANAAEPVRLLVFEIDGLNADLLYQNMDAGNLPSFERIFRENGTVFENFYTRGISLSAPSWSILDTGHHAIIRGNVEYDRYTGHVYDYLNFFPFYLGNARQRAADMPGAEVLDRAGIPLVIDQFGPEHTYQSFQLFQRGVRWTTLERVLKDRFSKKSFISMLEDGGAPPLNQLWARETEVDVGRALQNPAITYIDFYTGDMDHEGHATSQPEALFAELKRLDGLAGRLWKAVQDSGSADRTVFIVVSDHGMNNVAGIISQAFSIPDLLASAEGGGHHVITNRHELSDFKLKGLDPMVHRVINASANSYYLAGQESEYPTAWVDVDGNERASIHLRNNDLNQIHILLQQLARKELAPNVRRAAAIYLSEVIDRHRSGWATIADQLEEELKAEGAVIDREKQETAAIPKKHFSKPSSGEDQQRIRLVQELEDRERERNEYEAYIGRLRALLTFEPDRLRPFTRKISDLVPELSLGDNNSVYDLQNYIVGPAAGGLVLDGSGRLDVQRSFRFVDYFRLLAAQRVRNNPQPALSSKPVDFSITALPSESGQAYWIYDDADNQLLETVDSQGRISVHPVCELREDRDGTVHSTPQPWRAGLPLHLFEDPALDTAGVDRAEWLSQPHTEREWYAAVHRTAYSNAVIGITEQFGPLRIGNVPGVLGRYELRKRQLVQPDIQVFAADHWNFNVRNFNPGGNHGAFFRISTHSVWMLAGAGVKKADVTVPCDSLNFTSTILSIAGKQVPMPDRVMTIPSGP